MSQISGHSETKIKRIKNYWLGQEPPVLLNHLYPQAKYLLFDGTYFHKNGCLALLVDNVRKRLLSYPYLEKESYHQVYPVLSDLRDQGLKPKAITLDGHRMVTRAIQEIWPRITIQRCLFHIQRQGLMWIRYRPKTEAAWKLRDMLHGIMDIKTAQHRNHFLGTYRSWHHRYQASIQALPKESVANKDLKRTMTLISNALPNMFHFIKDQNIASTTNYLENFYSQLKHQYRRHRGLTERHKIQYLKWYCYFKNRPK